MKELKLYVWTGFQPDWTDGLAIAIAKTESEAKQLIIESMCCENLQYTDSEIWWGELEVRDIEKCAYTVSGGG